LQAAAQNKLIDQIRNLLTPEMLADFEGLCSAFASLTKLFEGLQAQHAADGALKAAVQHRHTVVLAKQANIDQAKQIIGKCAVVIKDAKDAAEKKKESRKLNGLLVSAPTAVDSYNMPLPTNVTQQGKICCWFIG
jgi:hypothetical protein